MNTVYSMFDVSDFLRHFRLNSYHPEVRTQVALATKLGRRQKDISNIENGVENPRLELIAEWCKVTGWYEGWKMIAHTYNLHPLAVPPIHPELSKDLGDAIINMRRQIKRAEEALDAIEEAYNSRRPTRKFEIDNMFKLDAREVFDLIPATETIMYAAERDVGLDITEINRLWTKSCIKDELLMPNISKMDKQLAVAK